MADENVLDGELTQFAQVQEQKVGVNMWYRMHGVRERRIESRVRVEWVRGRLGSVWGVRM